MKESAAQDAASGMERAVELLNQFDRSLVKQTVMTSVYGVTLLGKGPPSSSMDKREGFWVFQASLPLAFRASLFFSSFPVTENRVVTSPHEAYAIRSDALDKVILSHSFLSQRRI